MLRLLAFFACTLIGAVCFAQQTQTQTQTQTQPDPPPLTDIYLMPWPPSETSVKQIRNITRREGYDNQPMFAPDGESIWYTSIRDDEQADIYSYDIRKETTTQMTRTAESEYSPTFMPGGQYISVVRVEKDETQRLWKFPLAGGEPELILNDVKPVGYHCWVDADNVVLFILGEPNTLQIAKVSTGKAEKIADNIGRSIHKIPASSKISFTVKENDRWIINALDLPARQIRKLTSALNTSEDYVWTSDGKILMASGTTLFQYDLRRLEKSWIKVIDLSKSKIGKISRLAVHPKGTFLSFVAEERAVAGP